MEGRVCSLAREPGPPLQLSDPPVCPGALGNDLLPPWHFDPWEESKELWEIWVVLGTGSLAVAGQGGNLAREGTVLWCDPRFLAPVSQMEQATPPSLLHPRVVGERQEGREVPGVRSGSCPPGSPARPGSEAQAALLCGPGVQKGLIPAPGCSLCAAGAAGALGGTLRAGAPRFGSGSRQPVWETNSTVY